MTVLCPRHTIALTIVKRKLHIEENIYPTIIGRCPRCKVAYINRVFFQDKCATIEGETYEFLQEIYLAFPPEPIIKNSAENTIETTSKSGEKDDTLNSSKAPQAVEKPIQQQNFISKETDVKAKRKNRNSCIIEYVSDSKSLSRCPHCRNKNLLYKRIKHTDHGTLLTEESWWCRTCNIAYIVREQRTTIDIEPSNPKVEVYRPSHIMQKLPLLSGFETVCTFCGAPMPNVNVKYYVFDEHNAPAPRYTNAWSCAHCKAAFLDKNQLLFVRRYMGKHRIYTINPEDYANATDMMADTKEPPTGMRLNSSQCELPYEESCTKHVNLSKCGNTVWVYSNKCRCLHCERLYQRKTVISKTAVVDSVMRKNISIDIMFCMGCGKYFVNAATLEVKEKVYGILLFERKFTKEVLNNNTYGFDFAPDSILSRCGYSVRDGIPQSYRQAILRYAMEVVGISKSEIEEKINMFLHFHRRIKGHEESCGRWEDDIQFLHDYNINRQGKVQNPQFLQARK